MVPASLKGKYVIRFTVTSQYTTDADIRRDWLIIQSTCSELLAEEQDTTSAEDDLEDEVFDKESANQVVAKNHVISGVGRRRREGLFGGGGRRRDYGLSLILSNVPFSPNFINGSFAALFDDTSDVMMEYLKHLQSRSMDSNGQSSSSIFLSPRKKLRDQGKQYSLDLSRQAARHNTYKRCVLPNKQGSLDSKIEEIFDTSFESSTEQSRDESAAATTTTADDDDEIRELVEGMAKDGLRVPIDDGGQRDVVKNVHWAPVVNGKSHVTNGHA